MPLHQKLKVGKDPIRPLELPLTYPVAPQAAPTMRGQPLKSKLANAWEKVKELGRKVREKVKKEKESVLRKPGEYREIPGEEQEEEDDDDDEELNVQGAKEMV